MCAQKKSISSTMMRMGSRVAALAAASVIQKGMVRPRDDEVGELQSAQASDHQ